MKNKIVLFAIFCTAAVLIFAGKTMAPVENTSSQEQNTKRPGSGLQFKTTGSGAQASGSSKTNASGGNKRNTGGRSITSSITIGGAEDSGGGDSAGTETPAEGAACLTSQKAATDGNDGWSGKCCASSSDGTYWEKGTTCCAAARWTGSKCCVASGQKAATAGNAGWSGKCCAAGSVGTYWESGDKCCSIARWTGSKCCASNEFAKGSKCVLKKDLLIENDMIPYE